MKKVLFVFLFFAVVTNWDIVSDTLGFSGSKMEYTVGLYESDYWYSGYQGYQDAVKASDENKVPMIIYIYADWCKYCKKFEKDLLADAQIQESLEKFVKVKINPEAGKLEKNLINEWGNRGYPAMLFQSGVKYNPLRVNAPYFKTPAGWKMMNSIEFISMLNEYGS